ncbi:hypothetical protein [Nocardiopsis tropica]|uniref:Recombination endonuclease VII n=1 Tax=Nocardiopsis tropica TaxID=109330 RepID=A0ABV2A4U4_9ACTN
MASSGVCPVCERRVRKRKNSDLRVLHYINETALFSYTLKKCRGSDPHGTRPGRATIQDAKKTGIRCQACNKRVPQTKDFRPTKHLDAQGRECAGWRDNRKS